jgi:hypothetical protein
MRLETPSWLASSKTAARMKRWTVRRIDPWSTLKFALVFNLAIALVLIVMSLIIYGVASALEVRTMIEQLVHSFGWPEWRLTAKAVLLGTTAFGLASVIIWSGAAVCLVLLYNLVSELVGGIEVDAGEDRS